MKVVGLKNEELVPSYSNSFRTIVRWKKPLFTQSNVSYYVYSTTKRRKRQRERRASGPYIENTTVSYFLLLLSVCAHTRAVTATKF